MTYLSTFPISSISRYRTQKVVPLQEFEPLPPQLPLPQLPPGHVHWRAAYHRWIPKNPGSLPGKVMWSQRPTVYRN